MSRRTVVVVGGDSLSAELDLGMDIDAATQRRLEERLAKASIDFKIALKGPSITAPGEGLWPVGAIVNLGTKQERYVDPDWPGARDSGRSLGAWDVTQDGLSVRAVNDAVDARRKRYSEYVHFAGDPTGKAVEDAGEEFERLFNAASEDMADMLVARILGG